MKGRLNSTVWWIAVVNVVLFLGAAWLMYSAGENAQGLSIWDAPSNGTAGGKILVALCLCGVAALFTVVRLDSKAITPVRNLMAFSERFARGDYRARAAEETDDDFGLIAENLNRAAEHSSRLLFNQETHETLQKSVSEFLNIVSQIARGDLTLRGRVTNDALGNVVDSVNAMLDNFVKMVERIRKVALDVQSSAKEILIASEEISTGAIQQDQEITNTSSAVEEITVSMKQVSSNAEASAEVARRALDAAEQGNRSVRDTLEGMQRICSSVQATAKRIKALGDRSLEMSEIVNVINNITEQMNLVALNAESEAGRAGEAGKGFAVVADEVRKLAENSGKATKDIGALIKAIQAETSDAVVLTEEGTGEVEVGAKLAEQAGRALDAISTVVRQSAELVQEISLTSKQQVRATEGVANAMQIISNITRQTSQSARQTARSVEPMVHMTEQLNEALSQFRVSAGPGEARPELVNAVRH